ncbi:unnamed protein product [Phytophthora fragariaefolia]|uniref:Unnamed protein product n=1 Tax=Phytophthora fragariaefolia TaxID=1490495 RepID=A0A9W6WX76_9STRA|nr:unnamed protein product [Phytophthora fragariaefolia]
MSTPTTQAAGMPVASAAADTVVASSAATGSSLASTPVVTSTVTTSSSPKRTMSLGEYKKARGNIVFARDELETLFDVSSDADMEDGKEDVMIQVWDHVLSLKLYALRRLWSWRASYSATFPERRALGRFTVPTYRSLRNILSNEYENDPDLGSRFDDQQFAGRTSELPPVRLAVGAEAARRRHDSGPLDSANRLEAVDRLQMDAFAALKQTLALLKTQTALVS